MITGSELRGRRAVSARRRRACAVSSARAAADRRSQHPINIVIHLKLEGLVIELPHHQITSDMESFTADFVCRRLTVRCGRLRRDSRAHTAYSRSHDL
ncbi:hypothetical protein EVAR_15025_1 [Eumeta japonica]|uniref:Uncharacterized protein n=1 Tax=Eumeta variegata TaxID=151549 RepID=A0A4C1X775_EUMVA|nr:hypothetical protein EVAR_15025_1 [Eumeta japonica]